MTKNLKSARGLQLLKLSLVAMLVVGGTAIASGTSSASTALPRTASAASPTASPCFFKLRWTKTTLTYSYLGKHRYLGNAVRAANNWTDLETGIGLTPAPAGKQGDIRFVDIDKANGVFGQAILQPAWQQVSSTFPSKPYAPRFITIVLNQHYLDLKQLDPKILRANPKLLDSVRTYTATHELGHALGLAHSNACGQANVDSIMHSSPGVSVLVKNLIANPVTGAKPQSYDVSELSLLYPGVSF